MLTRNIVLLAFSLLGFAVIHTLTAGDALKNRFISILGQRIVEGWYRLAYNLLATLTFLPALVLMALPPQQTLYAASAPALYVMLAVQLIGVSGVIWSILSMDYLRFAGIRQVIALYHDDPLPLAKEPLQQNGVYRLVRHPLYLFSMIALWAVPVMTASLLVLNLAATAYFLIGSWIEEGRLEEQYGDEYRQYRARVFWFFSGRKSLN